MTAACQPVPEKSRAILAVKIEAPRKIAVSIKGGPALILSAYTIGILGISLLILAMQAGH